MKRNKARSKRSANSVLFRKVSEALAFGLARRGKKKEAVTLEYCAGDLSVDRRNKTDGAGADAKGASVALEIVVGEGRLRRQE